MGAGLQLDVGQGGLVRKFGYGLRHMIPGNRHGAITESCVADPVWEKKLIAHTLAYPCGILKEGGGLKGGRCLKTP